MTIQVMFVSKNFVIFGSDIQETLFNGKSYPGVRKIFPIYQRLSAGMMINGDAYFENVSMETLIGEFKNQTNFEEISDIKCIKDDFIKFLAKNTESTSIDDFVSDVLDNFKEDLIANIEDYGFKNTINNKKKKKVHPFLKKYSAYDCEFADIIPDAEDKQKYINIIWEIFSYDLQYEGTGIVFAGFDEGNHYSSHFEINVFFNNNGKIVYDEVDSSVDVEKPEIKVYAINEEAYSFITGVHEDFIAFILNYIDVFNEEILDDLKWSLEDLHIENVDKIVDTVKNVIYEKYCDVEKDIIDYRLSFIEDTSYSMEHLPAWLISVFVDLLIYLTAVKQKTTSQLESVSMTTDIAIMRKHEGFKFIKDDSRIF